MSFKPGPAHAVVGLAVGLTVAIFAIFAVLVWQGYAQVVAQAETKTQSSADVVAQQTQWLIGSMLLALKRVEATIADDPANFTDGIKASFDAALTSLPSVPVLGVYDAAGKLVRGGAGLPADISGADYFKAVAGGQDWQVSPQIAGAASDKPIFVVAKRFASAGTFTGTALVGLSVDVLANFWAPLNSGPDSTVSLLRGDGWIVARYPSLPQPLNLKSLPAFANNLLPHQSGTYVSASSVVDGVARVVGFRHVPRIDLIAVASVSQDSVLGPLWASVWTVLLLMVPIAVALLAGSILTARLLVRGEHTRRDLEAALAQNQVLFREIHHRVKNNLQSVFSLVQLQPIAPEIKVEIGRRIAAMSAVHEHIYRSDNFDTVSVREYLSALIANLHDSYGSDAIVDERLADLRVDKDAAMPLGLIVNEVVSNAFKHAFPNGRKGTIAVVLERAEGNLGRLVITDDGVGFDPAVKTRGMGRRLIVGLSAQLGGEGAFTSGGGSRFTLTFPLAPSGQVS